MLKQHGWEENPGSGGGGERLGAFQLRGSDVISGTWGGGQMGQGERFGRFGIRMVIRGSNKSPSGTCYQLNQTLRWVDIRIERAK